MSSRKGAAWRRKLPLYRELWEVSIDGQKSSVVVSDPRDLVERALFELGMTAGSPLVINMRWKGFVS